MAQEQDAPLTSDGRVPGTRGLKTRDKLLEHTHALLDHHGYRELKVVEIARQAGTSPATFYQYFPDVEAAILALAEQMAAEGNRRLTALLRATEWDDKDQAWENALSMADGYIQFWDDNWQIMRVIDLTAEEGDQRFRSIRTRLLNEFTTVLAEIVTRHLPRDIGRGADAMATAGVLVSMLAHVASHRYGFEFYGIRTDALRTAMAQIIYSSVTGQVRTF